MDKEMNLLLQGGGFIIQNELETFVPENFPVEQKEMARAANDFIKKEIHRNIEKLENQEDGVAQSILEKAGEMGLLGISIPEKYNGVGLNTNASLLIADMFGSSGSFSTTYGAHSGIGTLPIMYYGTKEQIEKYVPKIVTAELKSCYCLTEPGAGSDANAGKTKAVLSPDRKHYILNGQKIWISNSGYADIFIVFAKIDNDKNLSAFIVEKSFGGIELGLEEKKLGIKGSSTRQVFFKDCKVPVENLLSERENGFKIAVNILNLGRLKLGAGVLGQCRYVINLAFQYSKERQQFGSPIFAFGAIKEKLATMLVKTFATESICYRTGHLIDLKIKSLKKEGKGENESSLKGVEEFAVEASLAKIFGSETLDYIVDEGVQIYGGMGYSAEMPMERSYRDARISRIYEGTNEINRMLAVGMLLKRALKGKIDMLSHAKKVADELTEVPSFGAVSTEFLGTEKNLVKSFKKAFLLVGGKAAQTFGDQIEKEQEVLMRLADILIEIYVSESSLLRAYQLYKNKAQDFEYKVNLAKLVLYEASVKINAASREVVLALPKSDEQKVMLLGLKRFTKPYEVNVKNLRREVIDYYKKTEYPF